MQTTDEYEEFYNPTSESGGALDSLVNDLMSKMSTEEHKPTAKAAAPNTPLPVASSCSACGKGISRSDQIVNMHNQVRLRDIRGCKCIVH
jgi:hypothetical protein